MPHFLISADTINGVSVVDTVTPTIDPHTMTGGEQILSNNDFYESLPSLQDGSIIYTVAREGGAFWGKLQAEYGVKV